MVDAGVPRASPPARDGISLWLVGEGGGVGDKRGGREGKEKGKGKGGKDGRSKGEG